MDRRNFLKSTTAGIGLFSIVPSYVLGQNGKTPPSEKLNIAGIGVGGMGKKNLASMAQLEVDLKGEYLPGSERSKGENIVALCDVDEDFASETFELFPKAKVYTDYRQMLTKQKDIDAVMIATPDHTHAVIAMMAMNMGKHVYLQKPMSHSIDEARKLTETAQKTKVMTQMGNQGHSGEGMRLIGEWIWDGAIGPVREVHAWTNRPIWPQGIATPSVAPKVPSTLNWDLWIGPAPDRPYHPVYHPRFWRGWWDFGTGAFGDMGCHILDSVFWALKLQHPDSVQASSSQQALVVADRDWALTARHKDSFPAASIVQYDFPARGTMPPVKLKWYDGGLLPERPEELEPGRMMGDGKGGAIFIGDKGKIMCGTYGDSPRIIPETAMRTYQRPAKTIERIPGGPDGHEQDWIRACKTGKPACSNFDYAGPFTEMVLTGNIALRFPGERLHLDGANMKVKNIPQADAFFHHNYRQGWSL
ncbi:MAG: Gfo/Idh/MocA family protein [Planctomycetota bacterium]|jgi:predicted dehydrogenase